MNARLPRRRRIDAPGGRWLITGAGRGLGRELAQLVRTHSLDCATKSALSRAGESLGVELAPGSSLAVVSALIARVGGSDLSLPGSTCSSGKTPRLR